MSDHNARNRLAALFLVVFIALVGFGIFVPILPFYGEAVGASPTEITLAMAAYSAGQFVGAPMWGRLADKIGRRPVMLISSAGAAIAYVIAAHATGIWWLIAARLFGGIMAGNVAAAYAIIADVTTPANRSKAMGLVGVAFGLGFIFGPAIGGLVAGSKPSLADFTTACYVAAGIASLACLMAFLFIKETLDRTALAAASTSEKVKPPSFGSIFATRPTLTTLITLFFGMILAASMMEATIALYAAGQFGWGPREIGLAFGVTGVLNIVLQGAGTGRLTKMFGERALLVTGLLIYGIALGGLALSNSAIGIVVALAMTSLGIGLLNPAISSLVSQQAGPTERGAIMGLNQAGGSMGRILGPLIGGFLFEHVSHHAPFISGAVVTLICAAAAWWTLMRRPARAAQA